jgi:hypothetical protein
MRTSFGEIFDKENHDAIILSKCGSLNDVINEDGDELATLVLMKMTMMELCIIVDGAKNRAKRYQFLVREKKILLNIIMV